jgi:arginine exporter protein ArgO
LNPHVYLDTILLPGSIGARQWTARGIEWPMSRVRYRAAAIREFGTVPVFFVAP